jgi:cellulose synthase/poly-beta-1,6-N-acetylglucosamine synthase-like glycosyltransferase
LGNENDFYFGTERVISWFVFLAAILLWFIIIIHTTFVIAKVQEGVFRLYQSTGTYMSVRGI